MLELRFGGCGGEVVGGYVVVVGKVHFKKVEMLHFPFRGGNHAQDFCLLEVHF